MAPEERKVLWRRLGLFPGGIHAEMMRATSSCPTNVDGHYVSLAMKAMRLGIAMAYQSQVVDECCQDILLGIPRPHMARLDLGVLHVEADPMEAVKSMLDHMEARRKALGI